MKFHIENETNCGFLDLGDFWSDSRPKLSDCCWLMTWTWHFVGLKIDCMQLIWNVSSPFSLYLWSTLSRVWSQQWKQWSLERQKLFSKVNHEWLFDVRFKSCCCVHWLLFSICLFSLFSLFCKLVFCAITFLRRSISVLISKLKWA